MEQFVESSNKRIDDSKEMSLLMITDNAINELHNNGIFQQLSPEAFQKVHDEDPNIRIKEKTSLAKSVGYSFVSESKLLVSADGEVFHHITVQLNPAFTYSICLCIQGGLEELFLSGIYNRNKSGIVKYIISVRNFDYIPEQFKSNIELLNRLYDNFCLEIVCGEFDEGQSIDYNADTKKPKATNTMLKLGLIIFLLGLLSAVVFMLARSLLAYLSYWISIVGIILAIVGKMKSNSTEKSRTGDGSLS